MIFIKNKITVNSDMSEVSTEIINKDNEIIFNGNLHVIANNIVKFKNPNLAEDRLYTLTLAYETPQTIKILKNNIEGYEKEVKWENKAEHIIIIEDMVAFE